jgi:hypothetical protein
VKPLAFLDVPRRRQHHESSVGKTRQIVLHTTALPACTPRDGLPPSPSEWTADSSGLLRGSA